MNVLAVDPGIRHGSALALMLDDELVWCGMSKGRTKGFNWTNQLNRPFYEVLTQAIKGIKIDSAIVEMPTIYERRVRARASDIRDLIACAGAWAGFFTRDEQYRDVILVEPQTWKGNLPKEVTRARASEVLNASELNIIRKCGVPQSRIHNIWDAVCLALRACSRVRFR